MSLRHIKVPSTEKRLKRLIINPSVTEETFFLPFIQTLLNKLGLEEMVLVIDGSLVGRGCKLHYLSLRGLPISFLELLIANKS